MVITVPDEIGTMKIVLMRTNLSTIIAISSHHL